MLKKIKEKVSKAKYKIAMIMAMGSSVMSASTMNVSASIGDSAKGLSNTAQSEALGLAEVVGLIGVVACGILVFLNQRELAQKVGISFLGGYFILKYAQPIWNVIQNGI